MVARRTPLGRKLRAWRGSIFSFFIWLGAAGLAGILYLKESMTGDTIAVARTDTALLRAPESGRVASLNVKLGEKVEAGQVVAVLEIPGLQQEIAAATANLDATRSALRTEDSDRGRRFQGDIAGARAKYLGATVALREQESRLAELELEFKRVTAPGVALPAAEVESVTTRRNAAKALVEAQQREVDGLKASLDQAIGRAGGLEGGPETPELEALRLGLEALKARQEACTLRAPIAGVVMGTLPQPGTWMPAGLELMSVAAASTREAVVWLPADALHNIKVGASVSLEGIEGDMAATVESIGPGVQPVPLQALSDTSRPEWKVPILLQAERDLLPGEVLIAGF